MHKCSMDLRSESDTAFSLQTACTLWLTQTGRRNCGCCGRQRPRAAIQEDIDMKTGLSEEETEYLKLAIQLSDLSSTGPYGENHPFGAVIVLKNGTVIKGHNHVHIDNDPIQHAELYTVSQACRSG